MTPGRMMPSSGGVTSSFSVEESKTEFFFFFRLLYVIRGISIHFKSSSLTSIFIGPVNEKIHSSDLSDLLFFSIQPQNLLTSLLHCLILNHNSWAIITAKKKFKKKVKAGALV